MHSDPATGGYSGRLSDGRTAASKAARIVFDDAGLEITLADSGETLLWPYPTLSSAEPIRKNSTDTLLSSTELPGATLFVEGNEFTRALSARTGHLSTGSLRWSYAKPGLIVTASIAALVAAVWLLDLTPARTIAGWLPDPARVRMGQQVVQSMTSSYAVCHTDEGRAALDALSNRLSAVSGATKKFNVIVVDWNLLNAFAAPGEQIVLTREIIGDAKGPDEVAGVLAHEMGHGIELHPEAGLVRAIGISAAIELMSGGGSGALANAGALLAQLSYTRAAEREADAHALRILKAASISPQGLSDFFKRISKLEGEGGDAAGEKKDGKTPEEKTGGAATDDSAAKEESRFSRYFNVDVLRTHPASSERWKTIAAQTPYNATPSLTDGEWQALKSMCKDTKKKSDTKPKPESG